MTQKHIIKEAKEAEKKTGLKDAIRIATGKSMGLEIVIACMDFRYIGGSMGSVVGEKISKSSRSSNFKKNSIINNFKVWWSKNDGRCYFFNANG